MKKSVKNINPIFTMKALKIFALLLVMGASQASATGFAYNMNQAQKMLKTRKEAVSIQKKSKVESKVSSQGEKRVRSEASVETTVEMVEMEDPIGEKVVGTFAQWFSQALITMLGVVLAGR